MFMYLDNPQPSTLNPQANAEIKMSDHYNERCYFYLSDSNHTMFHIIFVSQ